MKRPRAPWADEPRQKVKFRPRGYKPVVVGVVEFADHSRSYGDRVFIRSRLDAAWRAMPHDDGEVDVSLEDDPVRLLVVVFRWRSPLRRGQLRLLPLSCYSLDNVTPWFPPTRTRPTKAERLAAEGDADDRH